MGYKKFDKKEKEKIITAIILGVRGLIVLGFRFFFLIIRKA